MLVLNNRDLNQVTWEQRVMSGDAKLEASQVTPGFPYAALRRADRPHGVRVDAPEEVADAWDTALAAGRPAVLEAITDPEVPPLPPHIRFEQAAGMAKALSAGDPASGAIVRQSIKGKVAKFLNR